MTQSRYSICITDDATEMPRCLSISIQSLVAWRAALRAFTEPAMLIAPENSSSFSVRVVLPASGCEMMAKVRRRFTCWAISDIAHDYRSPCAAARLSPRGEGTSGSAKPVAWRLLTKALPARGIPNPRDAVERALPGHRHRVPWWEAAQWAHSEGTIRGYAPQSPSRRMCHPDRTGFQI